MMSYHDGELSAFREARIREHLSSCESCAAALEGLERADRAVSVTEPTPEYWSSFTERVMDRVRSEERVAAGTDASGRGIHPWRPLWRVAPAVTVVFVAVVAIGILFEMRRSVPPSRVMAPGAHIGKTDGGAVPKEGSAGEALTREMSEKDPDARSVRTEDDRALRGRMLPPREQMPTGAGRGEERVVRKTLPGEEIKKTGPLAAAEGQESPGVRAIPPGERDYSPPIDREGGVMPGAGLRERESVDMAFEAAEERRSSPPPAPEAHRMVVRPEAYFETPGEDAYRTGPEARTPSQVATLNENAAGSGILSKDVRAYLDSRFGKEPYAVLYNEDLNRDGITEIVAVLPADGGRAVDVIADAFYQRVFSGLVAFREGVVLQEISGKIVEQVVVRADRASDATGLTVTMAGSSGWTIRPAEDPSGRGFTLNSIDLSGDVSPDQAVLWDDVKGYYSLQQEAAPAVR